jgi:hypothetical protein
VKESTEVEGFSVWHRLVALVYANRTFLSERTGRLGSGLLKLGANGAAVLYTQFHLGRELVSYSPNGTLRWLNDAPFDFPGGDLSGEEDHVLRRATKSFMAACRWETIDKPFLVRREIQ